MVESSAMRVWLALAMALVWTSQAQAQTNDDIPKETTEQSGQTDRERAQADVAKARKLARVQRYEEAVTLLQDAYLVLEDPDLLRMLGDIHADMGKNDAAARYYDDYLADPTVGEMSKASAREKRAALEGVEKPDGETPKEDDDDGWFDGWESSGAAVGAQGDYYVSLGARYSQNEGADFSVRRGGEGPDADDTVNEQWVHVGGGGQVEFGGFLAERLSLGLGAGLDVMAWENRALDPAFDTEYTQGLRPEVALNLRYHVGFGFHFGVSAGADMMIVTEAASDCAEGVSCEGVETIGTGVQGFRLAFGLMVGYRAFITDDFSLGMDVAFKQLPLFIASDGPVGDLPGYTDSSFLVNVAVVVDWTLR